MESDGMTLVFRALADPTRRRILEAISVQPMHVAELTKQFPISRPAISKHLAVLKDVGLVSFAEQGKKRLYRMEPAALQFADSWLQRYRNFWQESLLHLKEHVESPPASAGKRGKR